MECSSQDGAHIVGAQVIRMERKKVEQGQAEVEGGAD